jgi:hypothetical protein
MMPRWTLPCSLFLLLALGGAWSFREGRDGVPMGPAVAVVKRGGEGVSAKAVDGFLAAGFGGTAMAERRTDGVKSVASIGAGAAALLAEEIALRALAGAVELSLSEQEWAGLATVTLNTQAVRHAYEAEIAVVAAEADGRGRLEIPEYAEAGTMLRTEFYAALREELGESSATEVMRKLSERLESHFAGFGAAVQTLDVSLREGRVTRTVAYWDERDASAETRMRSETVFPQLEDPEGAQWGPLIARVEAAQAERRKGGG